MSFIKINLKKPLQKLKIATARNSISLCFAAAAIAMAIPVLYTLHSPIQISLSNTPTCSLRSSIDDTQRYINCFSPRTKVVLSANTIQIDFSRLQFAFWQPRILSSSPMPVVEPINIIEKIDGKYKFLRINEAGLPNPSVLCRFDAFGVSWIQSCDYTSFFPSHSSTERTYSYWRENRLIFPSWPLYIPLIVAAARLYILLRWLTWDNGFPVILG